MQLKKRFEKVICIMSGEFVQRGEIAVCDEYTRAKAAVLSGADAVFSLPFPYSCSSAADFAKAGTEIAALLGADYLAFGVQSEGEEFDCEYYGNILADADFDSSVRALIKENKSLSYPKAVLKAVESKTGVSADFLKLPNNILAVNYARAACLIGDKYGKKLKLFPIKRDCTKKSSSEIRKIERESGKIEFLKNLPENSRAVYENQPENFAKKRIQRAQNALLFALRTADYSSGERKELYGLKGGIYDKIKAAAFKFDSLDGIIQAVSDANITKAAAARGILTAALGISAQSVKKVPSFTRLLAVSDGGRAFLRRFANERKKKAQRGESVFPFCVITKPADIKNLDCESDALNEYRKVFAVSGFDLMKQKPFVYGEG